jgi:hypothetical protein
MSDDGFSIAAAEAKFTPEQCEFAKRDAANAPRFTPEQHAKYLALFATARLVRPADPAADAA